MIYIGKVKYQEMRFHIKQNLCSYIKYYMHFLLFKYCKAYMFFIKPNAYQNNKNFVSTAVVISYLYYIDIVILICIIYNSNIFTAYATASYIINFTYSNSTLDFFGIHTYTI